MATYYIVENNQQAGPFTLEQLAAKGITPDTNVWTEGMANWTLASQVSELQFLFAPQTPPQTPRMPEPEPAPMYEQPSYNSSSYQSPSDPSSTKWGDDTPPMPKDYKTQSIIILALSLLCCPGIINTVLGILALLENNKVETQYRLGNYAAAQASSDKAGKYVKIGFILLGIGVVLQIIAFIIYIIVIVANS